MSNQIRPSVITKDQYDSICRNAINDHNGGYYKNMNEDPLEPGRDWPFVTVPNSPKFNKSSKDPPPPPGPIKRTFASERIPSETIAEELARISKENQKRIANEKEEKNNDFKQKAEGRYKELMEFLTDKYYNQVVSCLQFNAKEKGKREAFMNFTYEDFKANMPTLGKPRAIQRKWIEEMKNPNSIFLKGKRPLQGISYDCWGNGSFTVHFTW